MENIWIPKEMSDEDEMHTPKIIKRTNDIRKQIENLGFSYKVRNWKIICLIKNSKLNVLYQITKRKEVSLCHPMKLKKLEQKKKLIYLYLLEY